MTITRIPTLSDAAKIMAGLATGRPVDVDAILALLPPATATVADSAPASAEPTPDASTAFAAPALEPWLKDDGTADIMRLNEIDLEGWNKVKVVAERIMSRNQTLPDTGTEGLIAGIKAIAHSLEDGWWLSASVSDHAVGAYVRDGAVGVDGWSTFGPAGKLYCDCDVRLLVACG
jgi:hypothetical protein